MHKRLKDKVALITGASRGIGRAMAVAFASEGADIVINYQSDTQSALEVCTRVQRMGRQAIVVRADVSDPVQVASLRDQALEAFGRIDVLVNNAGMSRGMDLLELTEEVWDRVIDINLKGTFLVTQAIAPSMLEQKSGVILNLSSIAGMVGATTTAPALPYNAAKQGVVAMTRTFAKAFAPLLRVNAIAPGLILTDFHVSAGGSDEAVQRRIQDVPLQRGGEAEEMAAVALFLACDDSSYITGHTINVDGGIAIGTC